MNGKSHGNDGKQGNDENHYSHYSHHSHSSHEQRPIIPPRGDYQTLLSYQKAEVVYDITFRFTQRFLAKVDRTIDQMIQSARSGKQNIPEAIQWKNDKQATKPHQQTLLTRCHSSHDSHQSYANVTTGSELQLRPYESLLTATP